MAKFTRKRPKMPKKGSKSDRAYAEALARYKVRLADYNKAKAAHAKIQGSKPRNKHKQQVAKLKAEIARMR